MASGLLLGTRSKVTLTNWERLNNSPLLLPHCTAVQWNEYVFVLTGDGTALLYHTKHGMWSMLPPCPCELQAPRQNHHHQPDSPPPLTIHEGQIVTIFLNKRAHFDIPRGRWRTFDDNFIKMLPTGSLHRNTTTTKIVNRCILTSAQGSLVAVVGWTSQETVYRQEEKKLTKRIDVMKNSINGWEKIHTLKANGPAHTAGYDVSFRTRGMYVPFLQSAAVMGENLFVLDDENMYKVSLTSSTTLGWGLMQPAVTTPTLTKPPYEGSTLHVVKDTLFAFGGRDEDNQPTSDMLQYNQDENKWEGVGNMKSSRYGVAVVTLQQDNELNVMVIGGSFGGSQFVMRSQMSTARAHDPSDPTFWENPTSIVEKCVGRVGLTIS